MNNEYELKQLDKEIKQAALVMRLYCWVVMPSMLSAAAYVLYSLFN